MGWLTSDKPPSRRGEAWERGMTEEQRRESWDRTQQQIKNDQEVGRQIIDGYRTKD